MNDKNGVLARHRGKLITAVIVLLSFPVAYYFFIVRNPLPTDDEMIAHFQAHRSDIEELVRRYRNYSTDPKVDHSLWFREGDTQEIMRRARVDRLAHGSIWLANPYSIESAIKIKNEIKNSNGNVLFYKYGALMLSLLPRQYYRLFHLRYVNIWKDFYFIPEIARIKDNELLWPINTRGDYSARRRILPSLNGFPDNWKDFECVFRQIETHWYLRLCNGH